MANASMKKNPNILVIDVGGTNIKMQVSGNEEIRKVSSGPTLTPRRLVQAVKKATSDWIFDVVSIGYPGAVVHGRPLKEPKNLGRGWVGFNFQRAFGCPVRLVNDAAMQALGSYKGGRMLFLGLGTGLGSTLIMDGHLEPMELAHLPYRKGRTFEDYVGKRGLDRLGKQKWRKHVAKVSELLMNALSAEYVVLGGGNAKLLKKLPARCHLGKNTNAFAGGFRMWTDRRAVEEVEE
ncbi:MAG TPA: ROK family protein [Acidobacteriota bacterium]|nr:ROK family protein [Acidobacteriota bacterium]